MKTIIVFASLLLAACATDRETTHTNVEYGCKDVVFLGRVVSVDHNDNIPDKDRCIYTSDGECLEWRARYDLEISVKQVLRGSESNSVVSASYIAHGQIRDDLDFMFVLTPAADGYDMKEAHISDRFSQNTLADTCSDG